MSYAWGSPAGTVLYDTHTRQVSRSVTRAGVGESVALWDSFTRGSSSGPGLCGRVIPGRGHGCRAADPSRSSVRVDGCVRRACCRCGPVIVVGLTLGLAVVPATLLTGWRGSRSSPRRFRPVLTLQTFRSEEQAVAMANATRFGLAAVGSPGIGCGRRVSAR